MTPLSDEEFTASLIQWQRLIMKLGHRFGIKCPWELDDYVNETNLKAWTYRATYNKELASFGTWLGRVCFTTCNTMRNRKKALKRIPEAKLEPLYNVNGKLQDVADSRTEYKEPAWLSFSIAKYVESLSRTQRRAIEGKLSGKSMREIATAANVSHQAVGLAYKDGVKNLKARLTPLLASCD